MGFLRLEDWIDGYEYFNLELRARLSLHIWVSFTLYQFPNILKIWQIQFIIFSRLYAYSTASTSEAAYIIGGYWTEGIIAEYKDGTWRQMGKLAKRRSHHLSIGLLRTNFSILDIYAVDNMLTVHI